MICELRIYKAYYIPRYVRRVNIVLYLKKLGYSGTPQGSHFFVAVVLFNSKRVGFHVCISNRNLFIKNRIFYFIFFLLLSSLELEEGRARLCADGIL